MLRYGILVVVFMCLRISLGINCSWESTSNFKVILTSLRNTTGYWTAKVQLKHDGEINKEAKPWDMVVDHNTLKCGLYETVLIDVTVTAPPKEENRKPRKCPPAPGYELINGLGYYKFHTVRKNWPQATEVCAQEETHMIILNSEEEAKAMDSMIEKNKIGNSYHWVGIHDQYGEGKFITLFNESAQTTGYCKWMNNEPNGGLRENCGTYFLKLGLNDGNCSSILPFICEGSLYE